MVYGDFIADMNANVTDICRMYRFGSHCRLSTKQENLFCEMILQYMRFIDDKIYNKQIILGFFLLFKLNDLVIIVVDHRN